MDVDLIEEMGDLPEVTETVPDERAENEALEAEKLKNVTQTSEKRENGSSSGVRDSKGRSFSTDLHAVNADGSPIITTKGQLKLLKRGRPSSNPEGESTTRPTTTGSVLNRPAPQNSGSTQNVPLPEAMGPDSAAIAAFSVAALVSAGQIVGGDEWKPKKHPVDEEKNLHDAFKAYYDAKGVIDIPPNLALCIAVGGYMLPRFFMPVTKTRSLSALQKVKLWLTKRKMEKENKPKQKDFEKKEG